MGIRAYTPSPRASRRQADRLRRTEDAGAAEARAAEARVAPMGAASRRAVADGGRLGARTEEPVVVDEAKKLHLIAHSVVQDNS